MGLDLVIFVAAILLGIFIYWRESNSNKLYRTVNRIFNSKELRMKPDDTKGFVYKQALLPRVVYVVSLFLVLGLIIQFLSPFELFTSYNGVSAMASIAVGTIIGTYLANFVLKSGKIVDEKSESLGGLVSDTIEKGKEMLDDMTSGGEVEEDIKEEIEDVQEEAADTSNKKSARERLKDKGYLK